MLRALFLTLNGCVRSRRDLVLENLALRQQLAVLTVRQPRPRLAARDRVFWVILRRFWSDWTCSSDCAPRYRRAMASRRIQGLLETDLAQTHAIRQETNSEGGARTHLSHGCGEQHLGRAAYPRRIEVARIRDLRANRPTLDAKGAQESRAGKVLGSLPEQPPSSDRRD